MSHTPQLWRGIAKLEDQLFSCVLYFLWLDISECQWAGAPLIYNANLIESTLMCCHCDLQHVTGAVASCLLCVVGCICLTV